MTQTRKTTFFLKIALCITLALSLFGVVLGFANSNNLTAKADTVDFTDYWGLEDRTSWCNGGVSHDDMMGFGAMRLDTQAYFKTAGGDCWYHGNNAVITQNNGVDILQYIYVNGESARDAITKNATSANPQSMSGTGTWISNPAAWPIAVETPGDVWIRLSKTYYGNNVEIVFKAGFSLIRNDGVTIVLSDDVTYNYNGSSLIKVEKSKVTFNDEVGTTVSTKRVVTGQAIGKLPEVPAKDGYVGFWKIDGVAVTENTVINDNKTATPVYALEYEDLLGLEDRAWGAHTGEYYFGGVTLEPFGYFNSTICQTWYVGNTAPITANNGVDIMEYIYVNGISARALITANANGDKLGNSCTCWLSNPAACPVYVETTSGSGIIIRLLKSFFGDTFTFTFKEGFSLIRNDGEVIYVSNDITYTYQNGALGGRTVDKKYTLSFEGVDDTKTLRTGDAIGELPEVPANGNLTGAWAIDGVEITADTVYNYGANKTATPIYSKDITQTIGFGDWGVPQTESDIRYLWIRDNNAEIITAYPNSYWNDHADNKDSNYGVDIMEYILIDGESARSIINKNAVGTTTYKASSTFPLSNGGCYAPICIETAGDGIRFKVMVDYKTSFKVTFKAGFTLVNTDGERLYVTEDVTFNVGATMGDISKLTGYTLTFEGSSSRQVEGGATIGTLPAVPAKDGYTGVWTIDGVEITADTVYNYGADKTAVAVYTKDVTDTVRIEFAGHTSVQSNFKIFITPAQSLSTDAWWNINGGALTTANNGVDIMNYIYINDQNIRELSNDNRTNNTYPVGDATGWFTNSDQCRPVFVETNSAGIWVTVLHSFSTENYKVTLKAGFAILDANGGTSVISEDVEFICTTGGGVTKVEDYTLSFEGLDETVTVVSGQEIGQLPKAPAKDGYEGYWTIDGVLIDENTIYNYDTDKTAVASYRVDISYDLVLEDRAWGTHAGEYYFGVLDTRDGNVTKNGEGNDVKYLNSKIANPDGKTGSCWFYGHEALITLNNGIDIMKYIYINDTSARDLITANVNGAQLTNNCGCWLSNPAASPVYVESSATDGLKITLLQSFVGNYFEITFKAGFSIINDQGDTVYLSKDVTYKYIVTNEGTTLQKGELTDADLDKLNGQEITLKNGDETYLVKTTVRLTLPALDNVGVQDGLTQVFVGWTTDPTNISDLYPAGYKLEPSGAIRLHAVWIGFEMEDGASVRLGGGDAGSGIRFITHIDAGGYKFGVEKGLITGIGTFFTPTDYLDAGLEPTHASFAKLNNANDYYIDKPTETWRINGDTDSTWTFAAAFIGISQNQYSRSFSARGYLKIQFTTGEGYVYTAYSEENARSIYEVATSAYKDTRYPQFATDTTIKNYVNNVADLTWKDYVFAENGDAVGNYEVTNISVSGNTITVMINGNVTSAVVNGKRLANGSTSRVKIGDFVFTISGFTLIDGGFQFTLGATNKAEKESEESLYFKSSDADLDFFLNDFFKRHTGVYENGQNQKVNSVTAGVDAEEFFNHEWISMSYYWFNSFEGYQDQNGNNQDRIVGMNKRLEEVPIDDYGYVWSSNDRVRAPMTDAGAGEQKMGWPFPNNKTVNTAHWEFNSGKESWTDNISASASGGLYGKNLTNQSSNITFTSKSYSSLTSGKIYTFYAPLLEFEVRIDDATNIEDIYVWYTTSSATSFSEDKRVSVKEKAFLNYDLGSCTGEYNHILYLPMYAETAWGESTSTYVKQLRIEIALKSGKTLSGYVGLNYVRPTLDTRMSNNNSIYISSLRTAYDYTGDFEFLQSQMTRARKAYNFLMQMYDSGRGLKKESYLVGHGGAKESLNWLGNATNKSIASAISQGYWDILYMPEYDFQSNLYFQKALADMAYLEQVMVNNGVTRIIAADVKIKTAKRVGETIGTDGVYKNVGGITATAAVTKITSYQQANLAAIQTDVESTTSGGFWNPETGRFAAGYGYDPDKKADVVYDYGYVAWNLEAIYYGIATEAQASSIMNWLASEPNLYKYAFAPLSITVTGDPNALNGEYAAQSKNWVNCQFGGAILYTSFYDLMARIKVKDANNAFDRLQEIQAWYKEVYDYYVANGSDPYDFYRYYYDNKKIQCQGMGTAGAVGLDREFLESTLPMASVAYGFFGIDSVDGKTLKVAPELPGELKYWKMENLAFNKVKYDLTIYKNAIQLNNVRGGDVSGLSLTVALNYKNGQKVYVNGVAVEHTVENGKAYVTIDFGATIVEVK